MESSKCGNRMEVYTRVTGFYTPTNRWNPGKLEEFKNRKKYVVEPVEKVPE